MAPQSSTLAWKIPWMEEPGRLQSMGSLSWTRLSDFTFTLAFLLLVFNNKNDFMPRNLIFFPFAQKKENELSK